MAEIGEIHEVRYVTAGSFVAQDSGETINRATNPIFESAVSNAVTSTATGTWPVTYDTDMFLHGTQAPTTIRTGANSATISTIRLSPASDANVTHVPVTAGEVLSYGLQVRASLDCRARLQLLYRDSADAQVGSTVNGSYLALEAYEWDRVLFEDQAVPATATFVEIRIQVTTNSGNTVGGEQVWADELVISEADLVGDFFDPTGLFTGTDHQSTSALGDTILYLEDSVDFNEAGGTAFLDDTTRIAYTEADLADDYLVLAEPLATVVTADTWVAVSPVVSELQAAVVLQGDDEAMTVRVPHALYERLSEGIREEWARETVLVEEDDEDELYISDIIGTAPVIDGSFIDTDGMDLPDPQIPDGEAPDSSPTPSVTGGISSLFIRWAPILNHNPVTYEVHVSTSTGFTPGPSTLIGETGGGSMNVLTIDGEPLVAGETYYVVIIAKDMDGEADPSSEVSGTPRTADGPDISSNYAYLGTIFANQINGGEVISDLTLSAKIKTADEGARVEQDSDGIRIYRPDGAPTTQLETDGDSMFEGTANLNDLDVSGTTKLAESEIQKGKKVTLNIGTTPPSTAPTVNAAYDTFSFADADAATEEFYGASFAYTGRPNFANVNGIHVDTDEVLVMEEVEKTGLPFHAGSRLWIYDRTPNGAGLLPLLRVVEYHFSGDWEMIGIVKLNVSGTDRYFSVYNDSTPKLYELFPWDVAPSNNIANVLTLTGLSPMAIGHDGTNILLADLNNPTGSTGEYVIRTVNVPAFTLSGTVETTSTNTDFYGNGPRGVLKGSFDYGASRIIIGAKDARFIRSFLASGTPRALQGTESWGVRHSTGHDQVGIGHDGTNFYGLGSDGVLVRYSGIMWTSGDSTIWANIKWRNTVPATDYETALGVPASTAISKRQYLTVSHTNVPLDNDPVVPDDEPDSMGIYLARQTAKPTTDAEWDWQLNTARFVGSAKFNTIDETHATPPTSTVFPGGSPSSIVSSSKDGSGNPLLDIRADGYAKMNQLIVDSATDANATAGNKPALRVGPITGNHLRVDGNEILSMASDAVQSHLILNQNGETRAYQLQANTLTGGPQRSAAPYTRLYRNSTGSWANNTLAIVPLVLDEETDGTMGDTANNRIVAPIAGIYMVIASIEWGAYTTGRRELRLYKNGTVMLQVQQFNTPNGTVGVGNQIYWMGRLAASDTLHMEGLQASGAANNMVGGINSGTFLTARWMQP